MSYLWTNPSLKEMADYLKLPEKEFYVWSNSLITLDGYLSFLEQDDSGVEGVSFKKNYPEISAVDFRLLHFGWANADAILIGASELRNEKQAKVRVLFNDFIDYRVNVLKKVKQPALVILTKSGDLPINHPSLKPNNKEQHVIIVTTTLGSKNLVKNLSDEVIILEKDGVVDLISLMNLLKEKYKHLDCAAGGIVIEQMIQNKLIDEVRITLSMQLCGSLNTQNELRPHFFPCKKGFTQLNSPHLKICGIRQKEDRLLFLRAMVEYRH